MDVKSIFKASRMIWRMSQSGGQKIVNLMSFVRTVYDLKQEQM